MFSSNKSVESLKKRAGNIVNVFTKTVNDLTKVNEEIEVEINSRQVEALRLNAEAADLKVLKTTNEKVVNKINDILA